MNSTRIHSRYNTLIRSIHKGLLLNFAETPKIKHAINFNDLETLRAQKKVETWGTLKEWTKVARKDCWWVKTRVIQKVDLRGALKYSEKRSACFCITGLKRDPLQREKLLTCHQECRLSLLHLQW